MVILTGDVPAGGSSGPFAAALVHPKPAAEVLRTPLGDRRTEDLTVKITHERSMEQTRPETTSLAGVQSVWQPQTAGPGVGLLRRPDRSKQEQ